MKFTILGLEYQLGPNRVFHDDGYVSFVLAHRKRLDAGYGCLADEKNYRGYTFSGEHAWRSERLPNGIVILHNHIYCVDHGFLPSNINTRGHEETHAVELDGMLHLLADKILEERRVRIDFANIEEEEVRAEIGGIFALDRRGFNPQLLMDRPERPTDIYFGTARRLYEQSRLPQRTIFVPRKPALALEP